MAELRQNGLGHAVRAFLPEQPDCDHRGHAAPAADIVAGRVRVRAHALSRPQRAVPAVPGHADDPVPGDDDPEFHPGARARLVRYLPGADLAAGVLGLQHLLAAPVFYGYPA